MTSSVAQNSEAAPKMEKHVYLQKRKEKKKKKPLLLERQYEVFRETKHGVIQDLNVSKVEMCRHCSNEPSKTKPFFKIIISVIIFCKQI